MQHKGTVTLETERLILRRLTVNDAHSVFTNWASDSEVTRFLTWPTHTDEAMSEGYMNYCAGGYANDDFYQWGLELKENGELIGNISAVRVDDSLDSVELGWVIGRTWWGHGYTAEAAKRLIDFFFDEVGAQRIAARFDTNNPNSGRVMQKAGMKYEGTLRRSDRNNQGIVDCSWYSILREER